MPVQAPATPDRTLVMRVGQRFESARRLSPIGIGKQENRNKCGSQFIIRGLLTPLTLHQLNGGPSERLRDDPQISVSTLGEDPKSLPSSIGPRAASPLAVYVVEASSSSRAYATACSKVIARPSA